MRFLTVCLALCLGSAAHAQDAAFSSNLPVVTIDTEGGIPDEPKVMARMRVADGGARNAPGDTLAYDGWIGIEQRGSSSARFPKTQYAVETRHADGRNRDVPLLGLPPENDWVLHAPYSDKSLLRNALAFHVARATGRYASRARFCELVLDGDYRGVYLLLESVKDDSARVDLADTDSLGGGFIARLDKPGSGGTWPSRDPLTRQFVRYQFHDPDDLSPAQRREIEATFDAMEAATADPDAPAAQALLDLDSVVDYVIVSELAKNIDAYRISTYFHRPARGAPIRLGPLWDFNLAFGNADYGDAADPTGFQYDSPYTSATYPVPSWLARVVASDAFQTRARRRWTYLRRGPLATDALGRWIDATVADLDEAQARNFARWPILGTDVWPNAFVGGSYAAEVGYVREWLARRLAWLDGEWLETDGASRNGR